MSSCVYIYALAEPDTGDVRYVGKTNNPSGRYRAHLKDKTTAYRGCWIRSLAHSGKQPILYILETVTEADWEESERRWIAEYRAEGANLTNRTDGGEGRVGYVCTPEERERTSIATRQAMTSEVREKIRTARAKQVFDQGTRAKIGFKSKGNKHAVGNPGRRGHPWTSEERALHIARLTGRSLSQAHKQKIAEGVRKARAQNKDRERV